MLQPGTLMAFSDAADAVKQSLDVVDIVSRHVVLKKSGRNYTGLCPFHKDTKPSFNVSPEKGIYKCFSCGEGGDALAFLMNIQAKTYADVITELAEDLGITIQRDHQSAEAAKQKHSERQRIEALNQLAQQYFQSQLSMPVGQAVCDYLAQRHIPETIIAQFGLGYAPQGWENLLGVIRQHFPEYQQDPSFLETAGLAMLREQDSADARSKKGAYDRFRNRLMIPIFDEADRLVAFGGRSLSPDDNPKYLNSPETAVYHKSNVLYALNWAKHAIRDTKTAMVMEGYFDVMAAHEAGCAYAVASCGTALTEQQVKQLLRFGAETLILAFDSDDAGQKAVETSIQLIQPIAAVKHIRLKVLQFPGGKDPDDYLRHHGAQGFQQWVATGPVDALTFQIDRAVGTLDVRQLEDKVAAVQRVMPILARVTQPVKLREVVEQVADRLQVHPEDLFAERQLYRQQHFPEEYHHLKASGRYSASNSKIKGQRPSDTKYYNSVSSIHQKAIRPVQGALHTRQPHQRLAQDPSQTRVSTVLQRETRLEKALMTLLFVSPQHTVELFPLVLSHTYAHPALVQFAQTIRDNAPLPLQTIQDALHLLVQQQATEQDSSEWQNLLTDMLFDADVYNQRFRASGSTSHQVARTLQQDAERFVQQLRQCDRLKQLAPMTEQIRELEKATDAQCSPGEASLLGLQYEFRDRLSQHRLPPETSSIAQDDAPAGAPRTGYPLSELLPDESSTDDSPPLNC